MQSDRHSVQIGVEQVRVRVQDDLCYTDRRRRRNSTSRTRSRNHLAPAPTQWASTITRAGSARSPRSAARRRQPTGTRGGPCSCAADSRHRARRCRPPAQFPTEELREPARPVRARRARTIHAPFCGAHRSPTAVKPVSVNRPTATAPCPCGSRSVCDGCKVVDATGVTAGGTPRWPAYCRCRQRRRFSRSRRGRLLMLHCRIGRGCRPAGPKLAALSALARRGKVRGRQGSQAQHSRVK